MTTPEINANTQDQLSPITGQRKMTPLETAANARRHVAGTNGKGRRPTIKQRAFVSAIADTLNPTEAARRVYNCANDNTASAMASENLSKPLIQTMIAEQTRDRLRPERLIEILDQTIEDPDFKATEPAVWANLVKLAAQIRAMLIDRQIVETHDRASRDRLVRDAEDWVKAEIRDTPATVGEGASSIVDTDR